MIHLPRPVPPIESNLNTARSAEVRKFMMAGLTAAIAGGVLSVANVASADVPRCQAETSTTTARFTVTQPAGAVGQWDNVFTHDFTVTVNPDGTFAGTGHITGSGADIIENVTGTFTNNNTTVSYVATVDGSPWTGALASAPMDGVTVTLAGYDDPSVTWPIEMKVSAPTMEVSTTSTAYKSHGQYVSAQGGGKEAAHSCVGMPLTSNKNK
jgi:hypothetical protein